MFKNTISQQNTWVVKQRRYAPTTTRSLNQIRAHSRRAKTWLQTIRATEEQKVRLTSQLYAIPKVCPRRELNTYRDQMKVKKNTRVVEIFTEFKISSVQAHGKCNLSDLNFMCIRSTRDSPQRQDGYSSPNEVVQSPQRKADLAKLQTMITKYQKQLQIVKQDADQMTYEMSKYVNQQLFNQSLSEHFEGYYFSHNDIQFFNQQASSLEKTCNKLLTKFDLIEKENTQNKLEAFARNL